MLDDCDYQIEECDLIPRELLNCFIIKAYTGGSCIDLSNTVSFYLILPLCVCVCVCLYPVSMPKPYKNSFNTTGLRNLVRYWETLNLSLYFSFLWCDSQTRA